MMLRKLLGDLIKYTPAKLLPALSGLITIPIISRLFLPEEYSWYVLAVSISHLLYGGLISGLGSGVIRFHPEFEREGRAREFSSLINTILFVVVIVSTCLAFGATFLYRERPDAMVLKLVRIALVLFCVDSVFNIYLEIARARERSGTYTTFDLLSRYGALGFGLLLILYFQLGIEGLLWGNILSVLILLPILLRKLGMGVGFSLKMAGVREAKDLLRYAWPISLGNLAMWGLELSDRYILLYYRSEAEVGLYSMGYQVAEKSINILVGAFLLTFRPLMNNIWVARGREGAEGALVLVSRVFLIACLPCCIGLTIVAEPLMRLLTAEAYFEGAKIIGFIAFSGFFWGLSQIAVSGLLLAKRTRILALNVFVATGVNVALNILLVPAFGFIAAGATTLIGFVIVFLLQAYQSRKELTWRFPFRTLRNVLVSCFVMGVCCFAIRGAFGTNVQWIGFILEIVVGALVYIVLLFALGEVTKGQIAGMLHATGDVEKHTG